MARMRRTARKRLGRRATPNQVMHEYFTYGICWKDTVGQFLAQYFELWVAANIYGISDYDGVVRLLYLLPPDWQGWASSIVSEYLFRVGRRYDIHGDLPGFVAALSYQYYLYRAAPYGPYILPGNYVMVGRPHDLPPDEGHVPFVQPPIELPEPVPAMPLAESDYEVSSSARSPTPEYVVVTSSDGTPTLLRVTTSTRSVLGVRPRAEFEAGPSRPVGVARDPADEPGVQAPAGTVRVEPLDPIMMRYRAGETSIGDVAHDRAEQGYVRRSNLGHGRRVSGTPRRREDREPKTPSSVGSST